MRWLIAVAVLAVAGCGSKPAETCEALDGSRVPLGTAENGAVCTNVVPGGWAVPAYPQEVDNGSPDN